MENVRQELYLEKVEEAHRQQQIVSIRKTSHQFITKSCIVCGIVQVETRLLKCANIVFLLKDANQIEPVVLIYVHYGKKLT